PAAPKEPAFTAKSPATGITSLEVNYTFGRQLHRARITDEKVLADLQKALVVVKTEPAKGLLAQSRNLQIVCKDKSALYGHILSPDVFFDFNAGKFTVQPGFFTALSKEVSRLEGFPVDVTGQNVLPEKQVKRGEEFLRLVAEAKSLRYTEKEGGRAVKVEEPAEAAAFVKQLRWVTVPAREQKAEKAGRSVEVTPKDGKPLTIEF